MRRLVPISVVLWLGLSGCADTPKSGEAAYCTEVGNSLGSLTSPNIATQADVDQTVALYRTLRDVAPLAIATEWDALVVNIETAASVVPDDPESVQRAADVARTSQQAATRVNDYTRQLCGVGFTDTPAPPATG